MYRSKVSGTGRAASCHNFRFKFGMELIMATCELTMLDTFSFIMHAFNLRVMASTSLNNSAISLVDSGHDSTTR
jgi:hypothetical protein